MAPPDGLGNHLDHIGLGRGQVDHYISVDLVVRTHNKPARLRPGNKAAWKKRAPLGRTSRAAPLGLEEDPAEALKWYLAAREAGWQGLDTALTELEGELGPQAAREAAAQAWLAEHRAQ